MRNVVVFGGQSFAPAALPGRTVVVDGLRVACGVVATPDARFDPAAHGGRGVLVRVRAVSCNYRDKGIISWLRAVPASRFVPIGSEFCGEVAAVGERVDGLAPGDRVMADLHYEGRAAGADGVRAGVPTNHASKELQLFHERQLRRVPAAMPDAEAAAFALNAQTAYSMVRRLDPAPGARVLVTSATSNTSLFVLGALRARGVRAYATTTSERGAERLRALGVERVAIVGRRRDAFQGDAELGALARDVGGFDHVFDPFFDLHLARAVELLEPFGSYVTCGCAGQTAHAASVSGVDAPLPMQDVMTRAIVKNLTLVGNCIGLRGDLEAAVRDYEAGRLAPVVDSVFTADDVAPFLDRTFNDPARFGKVVYRYD
jgi:NADPH:quinone reductase-like Zn-dependent oxidoreductase